MPVTICPVSRRRFLTQSLAAGVALATYDTTSGADTSQDANRIAFLADTHIPSDRAIQSRGQTMAVNLERVISEVIGSATKPAAAVISGDCAYLRGELTDYALLGELLEPASGADVPVVLAMGNHDNRDLLYKALPQRKPKDTLVPGKHVVVIQTPAADVYVIDTLREVNVVTGEVGQAQLAWLERALDGNRDRPAIVVGHHNPQFKAPANGKYSGIRDTELLFDLLDTKPQVKAYVYGHSHVWATTRRPSGLHLVNLPPVGYVFNKKKPIAWVDAQLRETGMELTLRALDPKHPEHGKTTSLSWHT